MIARLLIAMVLVAVILSGCAVTDVGDNLRVALLNHDDPKLVQAAAPAYMLLQDSLILSDPDDEQWLCGGARLYSMYAALFCADAQRARRLSSRAFAYGRRALCAADSAACGLSTDGNTLFRQRLQKLDDGDLDALYAFTVSWLVWAQNHSDDMTALAAVPKLTAALQRITELDESYDHGHAWMYLGILHSLRPPSLGGRPDEARRCFERALTVGSNSDLSVPVAYARYYARLVYNRELHDRLLHQVLAADPHANGLTLTNVLAQRQAAMLLSESDDYFP